MASLETNHVLALTRGTISTLQNSYDVYSDRSDADSLPSAFQVVAQHLPDVCAALKAANEQVRALKDEEMCKEIKPTAAGCGEKAKLLDTLFLRVVLAPAAETMGRYQEAAREIGKGHRVETLMKGIMEDTKLFLTVKEAMETATKPQLERLLESIKEVSKIPPSLLVEGQTSGYNNYGSGTQNINNGDGSQNNNNSTGQQFIGGTFGSDPLRPK
ncbi:hypothetical protein N7520_001666 [Penicillium odoratum]|uniref:uncharacterized protein n=1 Tax=Penicillium odoratum TaxID=1167516 RepID=UPI0025491F36|nr:uncharacterized protein N7520_001666 [Penicillium odoratum]KAJ5778420.1 hypothetical protein N7520_001666 [Penicillium odoratum]